MEDLLRRFMDTYRHTVDTHEKLISLFARAVDTRNKENTEHSSRIADMAARIAKSMDMTDDEIMQIRWGALLHDIGTIFVPESILLKMGTFTAEEWDIVKKHPLYADELLSSADFLGAARDIPCYHHEKWDGTGYPHGLKENDIPISARIFSVVDVWDALLSERPYREPLSEETIISHITTLAGVHYDPLVVRHFLSVIKD